MKHAATLFCMILAAGLLAGCASQSDVLILDERLSVMERQNQELQRQNRELQKQLSKEMDRLGKSSKSSESSLRSGYATINADIDAMQQELRLVSGRIEEISHVMDSKLAVYDTNVKLLEVIQGRINTIEQYLNIDSANGSGKNSSTAGGSAKAGTDKQMYADAKKAYDNGDLERARQGFLQLLKTYPKSSNADNAQFWIGESYYREKWYEKAILEYQTVIEKYPKGNKVAAAMLKQGMAFLKIGDKSNARLILKELQKKYPKSNEAAIAAKKLTEF